MNIFYLILAIISNKILFLTEIISKNKHYNIYHINYKYE